MKNYTKFLHRFRVPLQLFNFLGPQKCWSSILIAILEPEKSDIQWPVTRGTGNRIPKRLVVFSISFGSGFGMFNALNTKRELVPVLPHSLTETCRSEETTQLTQSYMCGRRRAIEVDWSLMNQKLQYTWVVVSIGTSVGRWIESNSADSRPHPNRRKKIRVKLRYLLRD